MRDVVALVCALALAFAFAAPVTGQAAPDPGYDVTVDLPDDFQVGDNEVRVVVDNTGSDDALFSPIVEVPLGTSLSAPAPDPTVAETGEERTYSVQNASYRDGQSLYVYGEEVPAGETRTYAFTLVVDGAGRRTVEADVRPLYNEQVNVRDAATATARPVGTLNVTVVDGAGATLSGATVTVAGATHVGGDHSLTVVSGDRTVGASAGGETLPELTVPVAPGAAETVRFTVGDSLVTPRVLATTGNGSIPADSVLRETTRAGDAVVRTAFELSFVLEADGGTSVVGVGPPPEVPPAFASVSATVDGSSVPVDRTSDGTLLVEATGAGPRDVTLAFEGFPTGDASGDGTVDAADARRVARAVAAGTSANPYGDVNGDGQFTAVDAMLIAQYDAGNRDADYGGA